MHTQKDIQRSAKTVIDEFAQKRERRICVGNILKSDSKVMIVST